ncbi:MAG: hypothetical protein PW734_08695 [Verrucomicrobium sp.]|nr:hypothetical protein [Verrucomicrobium sp.]
MSIQAEWNIESPAAACAVTGQPFAENDAIASALFWSAEARAYHRLDTRADAWPPAEMPDGFLSSWKSTYKTPPAAPPETLSKDDAEGLLRHLLAQRDPRQANASYILALMLERKRLLKEVARQQVDGASVLVYEHVPSGETWIIPNPSLRLDQMASVQAEVAELLAGLTGPATAAEAPSAPAA